VALEAHAQRSVIAPDRVVTARHFGWGSTMRFFVLIALATMMTGCAAATTGRMNNIRLGMTEADVVAVLGEPFGTCESRGGEYLSYFYTQTQLETDDEAPHEITGSSERTGPPSIPGYEMRFVDGKVESHRPISFGLEGDRFDKEGIDENTAVFKELQKLKELHDAGILADRDYETRSQRAIYQGLCN